MAIIIEGSSTCTICNAVLDQKKKFITTPAMISNMLDDLWLVNDCGVHEDCVNSHPAKDRLLYHLNIIKQMLPLSAQKCIVDQQLISRPEDCFATGLLTSDPSEKLFKFNHLVINVKNIPRWNAREEFIAEADQFLDAGKWKDSTGFNYLQNRLDKIHANS